LRADVWLVRADVWLVEWPPSSLRRTRSARLPLRGSRAGSGLRIQAGSELGRHPIDEILRGRFGHTMGQTAIDGLPHHREGRVIPAVERELGSEQTEGGNLDIGLH